MGKLTCLQMQTTMTASYHYHDNTTAIFRGCIEMFQLEFMGKALTSQRALLQHDRAQLKLINWEKYKINIFILDTIQPEQPVYLIPSIHLNLGIMSLFSLEISCFTGFCIPKIQRSRGMLCPSIFSQLQHCNPVILI